MDNWGNPFLLCIFLQISQIFSCSQTVRGKRNWSWSFFTKKDMKKPLLLFDCMKIIFKKLYGKKNNLKSVSAYLSQSFSVCKRSFKKHTVQNFECIFHHTCSFPLWNPTFGFCEALPLTFFGTPRVSKEWLRTLMAL